jgi:hypothetical protein
MKNNIECPSKELITSIKEAEEDYKNALLPSFDSVEEAIEYLKMV